MPKTIPTIMRRRPETRGLTTTANVTGGMALAVPSVAGITVTPQVALTFTAVFAAINVISRDFASLPPAVYRQSRKKGKAVVRSHPAHQRLNHDLDPDNPRSNPLRGRQSLMGHTLGWGNGYWWIRRDGGGSPTALVPLHPGKTRPKETASGRLYYENLDADNKGVPPVILPENMFHLAGLGFDGVTGYSPVAMAREAVGLGKAAEQFGASLFGNGAVPKGVLKTPKRLGETAQKNLRESIYRVHQGSNQGNHLMILEEGLEYQETQISPDDAQFLATRAFQVLEVARIFSLPPHKIGDYSQSHLANVEQANLDYLTTTLAYWLAAFEAEANLKLLTEEERARGLFIAHDMTHLLRGDMAARVAYYKGLWDIGAIDADEVRTRENLNPIGPEGGGTKKFVPLNLVPLDKAGDAPAGDPAEAPDAGKPTPPSQPDDEGGGDEPSTPETDTTTDGPAADGGDDDE